MVSLLDGPAEGQTLTLRRAPVYLRVVRDPMAPENNKLVKRAKDKRLEWDALDQLEDEPADGEEIYVYRRVSDQGPVHICTIPRSRSGWYRMAEYRHVPDVDGEDLRDTVAWRRWCVDRAESEGLVVA